MSIDIMIDFIGRYSNILNLENRKSLIYPCKCIFPIHKICFLSRIFSTKTEVCFNCRSKYEYEKYYYKFFERISLLRYYPKLFIFLIMFMVSILLIFAETFIIVFSDVYVFWNSILYSIGVFLFFLSIMLTIKAIVCLISMPIIKNFKFKEKETMNNAKLNTESNLIKNPLISNNKSNLNSQFDKNLNVKLTNSMIKVIHKCCGFNLENDPKLFEKILQNNVLIYSKNENLSIFSDFIEFHCRNSIIKSRKKEDFNIIRDFEIMRNRLKRRNLTSEINDLNSNMISSYLHKIKNTHDFESECFYDIEDKFKRESYLNSCSLMKKRLTNNLNEFLLESEMNEESHSAHKHLNFFKNFINNNKLENFEEFENDKFKEKLKYYKALLDEKNFAADNKAFNNVGKINTLPSNYNLDNDDIRIINHDCFGKSKSNKYENHYNKNIHKYNLSSSFELDDYNDESMNSKFNLMGKAEEEINEGMINNDSREEKEMNRLDFNFETYVKTEEELIPVNRIMNKNDDFRIFKKGKTNYKTVKKANNKSCFSNDIYSELSVNRDFNVNGNKHSMNPIPRKRNYFDSLRKEARENEKEYNKNIINLKQFDDEIFNKNIYNLKKTSPNKSNNFNSLFLGYLFKNKLKKLKSENLKKDNEMLVSENEDEDNTDAIKFLKKNNININANKPGLLSNKEGNNLMRFLDPIKDREFLNYKKKTSNNKNYYMHLKRIKTTNTVETNLLEVKANEVIKGESPKVYNKSPYRMNNIMVNDKPILIFESEEANKLKKESLEMASKINNRQLLQLLSKSKTNFHSDYFSPNKNSELNFNSPFRKNDKLNNKQYQRTHNDNSFNYGEKQFFSPSIKKIHIAKNSKTNVTRDFYLYSKSKTNEGDIRLKNNKYSDYVKLNKFKNFEIEESLNEDQNKL